MKRPSRSRTLASAILALGLLASLNASALESGFRNPPPSTRPWVYWYWITDNISRAGITRDLEAMARVGIGEAFIGNIFLEDVERGTVKALTEEWWGMVEHAIREGGRLGVDIGLFNCPGWSQSGGPWIKPEQAMRYLAGTERRVTGPVAFAERLPPPRQPFQPVSVLAFPAPRADDARLGLPATRVTCTPALEAPDRLIDGRHETVCRIPPGAGQGANPVAIDFESPQACTVRSLVVHPGPTAFAAQCALQVAGADGGFTTVRTFALDRSNTEVNVGPMPHGAVAIAFPATTGRRFRLMLTEVRGTASLAEIELSPGARLERFVEKQLGKMHPTPQPAWDTYLWPASAEPDDPRLVIPPGQVVNLTSRLEPDGTVRWDVPAGEWVILLTGLTPTGTRNAPASPEGQGLEVDKMNRLAAAAHFEAFIGQLLKRLPPQDRKAFRHVVADSYEMGSQNWTDGFGALFRQRYGYDPLPWLPVLTGRIVGSADQSDRFLWDLRRLIADRVARDYVGGLRDLCHRHGLKLWLENYGHWGFPAEFLQYGGQADQISGEFWATGELGSIELRAASSASHIYGMPITSAEAFTGGPAFVSTPWSLKRRGDWAATEGINHFVLHVCIHQPDERRPGINAWFGTEFNRHNTWFHAGRPWIDYLRRSHFLLQQGRHVADVAYFIGEDTPKMTGLCHPALPPGYDFDYINAEAIQDRLRVRNGRLVLPDGTAYRLLVLPERTTMRPQLLRAIRDLVAAGGVILGPAPQRSPSLEGYPACDAEVQRLSAELWGPGDGGTVPPPRLGKGRVTRGGDLETILRELGAPPDIVNPDPGKLLWTHRSSADTDLYFLTNQRDRPVTVAPVFRIRDKAPEIWSPDTGAIADAGAWERVPGGVRVALELPARGSLFVLFRRPPGRTPPVVEVTHRGKVLIATSAQPAERAASLDPRAITNDFTLAAWVRPAAEIDLPQPADAGVGLHHRRNDLLFPAHGESVAGQPGHACAGLSIGRNGVVVFEHSGNYFAPLLVHAGGLADWTHVALVYRAGQPVLYLDGNPARQGLKSRYIVHPAPVGDGGAGGPFQGEAGELQPFPRALSDAEVAALAKASDPPRAADARLPFQLLGGAGRRGPRVQVAEAGAFAVRFADGSGVTFEAPPLPAPVALAGPWELSFPPDLDAPPRVMLDRLVSLTEHPDPAVRHFSGTATYVHAFVVPAPDPEAAPHRRLMLDLGQVESLAEVAVNGVTLAQLWKPPFTLDVTEHVRPGPNRLEVRVTNAWRNRLIGDKRFPDGFPGAGPPAFKPRLGVDLNFRADDPLVPAGLLGPVRLHTVAQIPLRR